MSREAGNLRLATFREHFRITRVVAVDDCKLVSKPGIERTFLYSYLRLGARKISVAGLIAALSGCTVYKPHPGISANSLSQVRMQRAGPVRITAAVLGAE